MVDVGMEAFSFTGKPALYSGLTAEGRSRRRCLWGVLPPSRQRDLRGLSGDRGGCGALARTHCLGTREGGEVDSRPEVHCILAPSSEV